jgi:Holliday junction resolvase
MMVKRDAIHNQVVDVFRKMGMSVYDAAHAGNGFPDIVVGTLGSTYLVELKTGKAPLRPNQVAFAASWRGSQVVVLRSVTNAIDWAVGIRSHKQLSNNPLRNSEVSGGT